MWSSCQRLKACLRYPACHSLFFLFLASSVSVLFSLASILTSVEAAESGSAALFWLRFLFPYSGTNPTSVPKSGKILLLSTVQSSSALLPAQLTELDLPTLSCEISNAQMADTKTHIPQETETLPHGLYHNEGEITDLEHSRKNHD